MKTYLVFVLLCILLLTPSFAQTNASAGSQHDQLQQLTAQLRNSPNDQALREQIINLVKTMSRPPALPDEVQRRMARGFAAFKDAKSLSDYKDAVAEFEQATLAAPWYADAYYNLGQARAKAEDYSGASASLKLYLLAAPEAKDAADAKTLMYEMEYKQEKLDKERAAAQADAQRLAAAKQLAESFRGTWYGANCYVGESIESMNRGCTGTEKVGKNWHDFWLNGRPVAVEFEVENDGTVKLNSYSGWAGCSDVFGVPQGASFRDIRWEERPKDGPVRQIWSSNSNDGTSFKISCTRPIGADDSLPYRYVWWTRTP